MIFHLKWHFSFSAFQVLVTFHLLVDFFFCDTPVYSVLSVQSVCLVYSVYFFQFSLFSLFRKFSLFRIFSLFGIISLSNLFSQFSLVSLFSWFNLFHPFILFSQFSLCSLCILFSIFSIFSLFSLFCQFSLFSVIVLFLIFSLFSLFILICIFSLLSLFSVFSLVSLLIMVSPFCLFSLFSGKVPVLDLQIYVGEDRLVKHEFYEKPCANKFVIPAQSAHSKKMRMSVLVEEGLRRLRNSSRGLDGEVRRRVMTSWAMKLKRSGYPATTRHQVISEAVKKFHKMCEVEDKGRRPIHRAREYQRSAWRLEKKTGLPSGTKAAKTRSPPHW